MKERRVGDALADLALDLRETLKTWQRLGVEQIPRSRPLDLPSGEVPLPVPDSAPPVAPKPTPAPRVSTQPILRDPDSPWAAYAQAGDGAEGLDRLGATVRSCENCGLCASRTQAVFGVGAVNAPIAIVGEAPGYHEDQRGEPFVGKAGQMLDDMLTHVLGLPRAQVYITNVIKCRPPENRTPTPEELAACRPHLDQQLALVQPRLILAVGRVAAQTLLQRNQGIGALRGRWGLYQGIPVMPTYHPAYLLRQPQDKGLTFQDLKAFRARMDQMGIARGGDD